MRLFVERIICEKCAVKTLIDMQLSTYHNDYLRIFIVIALNIFFFRRLLCGNETIAYHCYFTTLERRNVKARGATGGRAPPPALYTLAKDMSLNIGQILHLD